MPIRIHSRFKDLAETAPKNTRLDGVKPTRTRRYLTPDEVGKLVDAVGRTAFPERNRLLVHWSPSRVRSSDWIYGPTCKRCSGAYRPITWHCGPLGRSHQA